LASQYTAIRLDRALNVLFDGNGDSHCGMRGFSRAVFDHMDLRSTEWSFASEFIIKAFAAWRAHRLNSHCNFLRIKRRPRICEVFMMAGGICDSCCYTRRTGFFLLPGATLSRPDLFWCSGFCRGRGRSLANCTRPTYDDFRDVLCVDRCADHFHRFFRESI